MDPRFEKIRDLALEFREKLVQLVKTSEEMYDESLHREFKSLEGDVRYRWTFLMFSIKEEIVEGMKDFKGTEFVSSEYPHWLIFASEIPGYVEKMRSKFHSFYDWEKMHRQELDADIDTFGGEIKTRAKNLLRCIDDFYAVTASAANLETPLFGARDAIEAELDRLINKRYTVSFKRGDKQVALRIIFDLFGRAQYDYMNPKKSEWGEFFSYLGIWYKSLDEIFSSTLEFFKKSMELLVEVEGYDWLKEIFFDRLDPVITIYIVAEKRDVGGFMAPVIRKFWRRKKIDIKWVPRQRDLRFFVTVGSLEHFLKTYGRNKNTLACFDFHTLLVHELAHVVDLRLNEHIVYLLEKFRIEGFAEFSAFAATGYSWMKKLNSEKIAWYIKHPIQSHDYLGKTEDKDFYALGFFMCFIIAVHAYQSKSVFNKIFLIDRLEFGDALKRALNNYEFQAQSKTWVKIFRRMPSKMFFRKYEHASKALGIETVISAELLEEGKSLKKAA
jgi:hypothetical protein